MRCLILRYTELNERGQLVHLGVQVVDSSDRFLDITAIQSFTDVPTTFYACKVNSRLNSRFQAELFGRRLIAFNDEIVHHEAIKIPDNKKNSMSHLCVHVLVKKKEMKLR
jgi:hypothetical protein